MEGPAGLLGACPTSANYLPPYLPSSFLLPWSSFETEAARVLEELHRFPQLERSTAAEFTAALAAQLERLFAPPPSQAALAHCA